MKKPKKRLLRRILRGLAIAVASLVVLVVVAIAALHTSWGKNFVRRHLEHKLAENVRGTLRIGTLDYSFMFGSIHIGDLEIVDAHGNSALRAAGVDIVLDRRSVLSGEPVIDDLAVHGLAVVVVQSDDGRSNFTELFRVPKQPDSPLQRFSIDRFTVDGDVHVTTPSGTTVDVSKIDIEGKLDARPITQDFALSLAPVSASVSVSRPGQPPRRLDAHVRALSIARTSTGVDLEVHGVASGPLGVDSVVVHAGLADGKVTGAQELALHGVRLDHAKLAAVVGSDVLEDDAGLDVTLAGTLDKLALNGSLQVGAAQVMVTGAGNLAGARPTYDVHLAGDGIRPKRLLRNQSVPDVAGTLRLDVDGAGIVAGDLEEKIDLAVHARGVDLSGKATLGRDQTVHADLTLSADPRATLATIASAGLVVPLNVTRIAAQLPLRVDLAVTLGGRLDAQVAVDVASTNLAVARGTVGLQAHAILENKQLRAGTAHLVLRSLDLGALAALASLPPNLRGALSGTIELRQDGRAPHADFGLAVAIANPRVNVVARGRADPSSLTVDATVMRDASRLAHVNAVIPIETHAGKLGLSRTREWKAAVDVAPTTSTELASLVPPELRARIPRAEVALHADVDGTPAHSRGRLAISVSQDDKRADVVGTFAMSPTSSSLITKTTLQLAHDPLAIVDATVTLPSSRGAFDLTAIAKEAHIDAAIHVPRRTFASLAALAPEFAQLDTMLGGTVGGDVTANGLATHLAVDAKLRWDGYRTAAGTLGHTEILASGTTEAFDARIVHQDTFVIGAHIDLRSPNRIAVSASANASVTPLLPLLPATVAAMLGGVDPGRVRSDLSCHFVVVRGIEDMTVENVDAAGSLAITEAVFPIPGSERRYRDLDLGLTASTRGLQIVARGNERDLERTDRRIEVSGMLSFAALRPAKLELDVMARHWLLFGGAFGTAASPTATIDGDVAVVVDLAEPVLSVEATVHSLTVDAPDRGARFLAPLPTTSDLIDVVPGHRVGRLPVQAIAGAGAATPQRPMNIDIHIPTPIRLTQGALAIVTHGDLSVQVHEDRTDAHGGLAMDGGSMAFFGKSFALANGSMKFSAEHPTGWLTLNFERQLPDSTVRNLSKTAEMARARISLVGPPTDMKLSFGGGTNIEFTDIVAVNNIGHARFVTHPGLPASESVQVPNGEPLLMTAFFAMLAPQLLFLDKIAAWSDPADGHYGLIQHVEADRYLASDRTRIRGVVRPPTPGRSSNELQYDRLLIHDDRTAAGVGIRGGDRGGGGAAVFLEWSSKH